MKKIVNWTRLYSIEVIDDGPDITAGVSLTDDRAECVSVRFGSGRMDVHPWTPNGAELWALWIIAERERRRVVISARRLKWVNHTGRAAIKSHPRRVVSWDRQYDIDLFQRDGNVWFGVYDWNNTFLGCYLMADQLGYPFTGKPGWSDAARQNAALLVIAQHERMLGLRRLPFRRPLGVLAS